MTLRRKQTLSIDVGIPDGTPLEPSLTTSFDVGGDVFHRDGMRIDAKGCSMRVDAPSHLMYGTTMARTHDKLIYEELKIGQVIGQGSSSVVLEATYACAKNGTLRLALKVINTFERAKRDQLIREIQSLYNCACPTIIGFFGAFYREGAISIALEFMDGGSLANVVAQVSNFCSFTYACSQHSFCATGWRVTGGCSGPHIIPNSLWLGLSEIAQACPP